jgi:2-methylcitrate dehydratase
MPYCIARAFLDGEMTLKQFSEEKILGDDVRALMDKIEIVENEDYTEAYGEAFPHRMVVHADGETYERELEYPKGHPGNPLTDDELEDKFRTGVGDRLDEGEITEALGWMRRAEEKDDASELFDRV